MTRFWRAWLLAAAGITALAGLAFAAITTFGATGTHNALFDLVMLPGDLEAPAGEVASFAIGVAGAVMVGWAVTLLILLGNRSAELPPSTWRAVTLGLSAWFIVDGIMSIAAGAIGNVVLNVAFLAMFAPALIATRPEARQ